MLDLSNARTAPLAGLTPKALAGVTISAAPAASRFILRGDVANAASAAFGVAIPTQPLRANQQGARAALWLGPDEYLLIAPEAETESTRAALGAALAGVPHALVDVSHRQTAILLDGPGAAFLLNSATPLDLSLEAFGVGAVARTIFDKAEIVLWRVGDQSFHVEVWRAFAPYVLSLLEAAREENAAIGG